MPVSDPDTARDVEAILACWAHDGLLMPPDHPAVEGRAAIAAYFQAVFAQRTLVFAFTSSVVDCFGDGAVERLTYTAVATPLAGGPPTEDVGKGLHVYGRRPDGAWQLTQDIWNSDRPRATPA
jgi:ketosteroid isomerase-like protein